MKLQTLNYLQRRLDGKVSKRKFNANSKTLFTDEIWLYVLEYGPTIHWQTVAKRTLIIEEIGVLSHPDLCTPLEVNNNKECSKEYKSKVSHKIYTP